MVVVVVVVTEDVLEMMFETYEKSRNEKVNVEML